jgi:putative membrane protein
MENNKKVPGPADHLANERTFLAWIRTSIALMGFGFVIVKFAVFLRQMSLMAGGSTVSSGKSFSPEIGLAMVISGALITGLAYWRYRVIEKQLNNGAYFPSKWLSVFVTVSIIIASIFLIIYLLPGLK